MGKRKKRKEPEGSRGPDSKRVGAKMGESGVKCFNNYDRSLILIKLTVTSRLGIIHAHYLLGFSQLLEDS